MNGWIEKVSPDLFWDVEQTAVDPDKNAIWLLERILQRGRWEDWILAREYYGKNGLSDFLPRLKLDGKSRHFLTLYCQS